MGVFPPNMKRGITKINALNKNDSLYTQRTEWKIKTADFRWFAEKRESCENLKFILIKNYWTQTKIMSVMLGAEKNEQLFFYI